MEPSTYCPDDQNLIGRSAGCEGCPGKVYCQSQSHPNYVNEDQEMLETRMSVIKHKVLVISGKGGVGKSSVAWQLALLLKKKGKTVGVLDVDICGPSQAKLFNCEDATVINNAWGWTPVMTESGVSVMSIAFISPRDKAVIWRGPKKTKTILKFLKDTYWGCLDYLIIDTPPGTSDEHLSVIAALKNSNPDGAIIVTTPQQLSVEMIQKEINFCQKMKLPIIGVIENMKGFICPCCGEVTHILESKEDLSTKLSGTLILGSIPLHQNICQSAENGEYSFLDDQSSAQHQIVNQLLVTLNDV
jgi:Mrp family chromosome partitioning ATPase